MVARSFRGQFPKAQTARSANLAAAAAKGRKNWSKKLRNDHRILAALEKLMKQWGGASHVPVSKAAKGLPFVAVIASTGTNAVVMGDVAKQARLYAQTSSWPRSTTSRSLRTSPSSANPGRRAGWRR